MQGIAKLLMFYALPCVLWRDAVNIILHSSPQNLQILDCHPRRCRRLHRGNTVLYERSPVCTKWLARSRETQDAGAGKDRCLGCGLESDDRTHRMRTKEELNDDDMGDTCSFAFQRSV